MNVWRWLGISIFLLGTVGLISTTNLSVLEAVAQDKKAEEKKKEETKKEETKKEETKKEETKKEEKKKEETKKEETKKEEPKKEEPKKEEKKKEETKKEETKKEETKKEEAKTPAKGEVAFTAFKKGSPKFYQLQKTNTKQEMKVMGQVVTQTQDQTFLIEWTPLDSTKDNDYVVAQKIVGVKMEINIGGNKIFYDSTSSAKQKNPMTDFFEQLTKQELKFTIKSDLSKVESIEGRDKFIQSLSDINPQMKSLLNAILSDKALTKMAEPTWYAFPKDGKFPATWSRKSDLDMGPIGKYETTFDFTYKGVKDGKDDIGIVTKMNYTAPTEKAGLPFTIHEAKLTADGGTGTATFDRAKGRFDKTELNMKLKGTLKIEVGNMTTQVELDQTQTSSSTTLDAIPDDWKSKQ